MTLRRVCDGFYSHAFRRLRFFISKIEFRVTVREGLTRKVMPDPRDYVSLFGRLVGDLCDFFGKHRVIAIYEHASRFGFGRVCPWNMQTPHPVRDVVARFDKWPHVVAELFC